MLCQPNQHHYHRVANDPNRAPTHSTTNVTLPAVRELTAFREAGGACLCESTTTAEGRDASALLKASLLSGVPIVMAASSSDDDPKAHAAELEKQLRVGVEVPPLHG